MFQFILLGLLRVKIKKSTLDPRDNPSEIHREDLNQTNVVINTNSKSLFARDIFMTGN